MTTESNTGTQMDAGEVWRAIGRLEGIATSLIEGQREIKADLQTGLREVNEDLQTGLRELRTEMQTELREVKTDLQEVKAELREAKAEMQTGLREVNRRVDRLFYAILGVGAALFVAMFISRFFGD